MIRKRGKRIVPSLTQKEIDDLHAIGAALAAERDLDSLLAQILEKCRQIVRADAGSLFLVEKDSGDQPTHLRFKMTQNDSVPVQLSEFILPINKKSLVGYVAETRNTLRLADVYSIPDSIPFRFNREIDRETGYRSKSVLSVPMVDHQEQLIGVMQLWNKKRNPAVKLTTGNVAREVSVFTAADQKLLTSLAAQAAVAIENAALYADIKNLFEGFIRASAVAIEARDPTTKGHSDRVATLTVAMAKEVNRVRQGPLGGVRFTQEQIQEIKYAALLHDFGKIGVRENLLLKAKKLFPWEMDTIRERLDLLRRNAELEACKKKIGDAAWREIEKSLSTRLAEISKVETLIRACNEPTILSEEITASLRHLSDLSVLRPDGTTAPVITKDQLIRLSIPKGSLSDEERQQVEAHVTHTFEFLAKIPWTRDLREVPHIARRHHEKLDGSGYPQRVKEQDIPLPSRMMAIADVFDALAARDRPYKKAIPVRQALDILRLEADQGKLDPELVRLFIDQEIYRLTGTP